MEDPLRIAVAKVFLGIALGFVLAGIVVGLWNSSSASTLVLEPKVWSLN